MCWFKNADWVIGVKMKRESAYNISGNLNEASYEWGMRNLIYVPYYVISTIYLAIPKWSIDTYEYTI